VLAADDRLLARQLARQARAAGKAQARAARGHASAVRRRERLLRRSRRDLPGGALVASSALTGAVFLDWWGLYLLAGYGGLRAVLAARRLLRPPPIPLAPVLAPGPPPPPHPGSAAFPAVRRLEQVRASLVHLVPLVAPVGRDAAGEAWQAAGEADLVLRWQAARLAAAEPHLGVDGHLVALLDDGVAAQERLVTAVADLVTASADPHDDGRLQDVTDRLRGLAAGLREVRSTPQ